MSKQGSEAQQQIDTLKRKCNAQIDYLENMQGQLVARDERIKELELTIANNTAKNTVAAGSGKDNFLGLFYVFYDVVGELIRQNDFFEVKRTTKNSVLYRVVENNKITSLIGRYAPGITAQKVIRFWAEMGLVGRDENGHIQINFTQKGHTVRSLRLNRPAVELVKDCLLYD